MRSPLTNARMIRRARRVKHQLAITTHRGSEAPRTLAWSGTMFAELFNAEFAEGRRGAEAQATNTNAP